jgi:hypothetical protein
MPAVSQAQFRLMQAAKHNPEVRERTGISKKVASEFTQSSPKGLPQHKAQALRGYRK